MIAERYIRNLGTFTDEELKNIRNKRVAIIGCGGLGGYCANSLVRFGIGELTLVDGDNFSVSNLNRQLFSSEDNIGKSKVEETAEMLRKINSDVKITEVKEMLDSDNYREILSDQDLVIDCLDNISSRIFLAEKCDQMDLVLVHGALEGWYGQVANIFPGDNTMEKIYSEQGLMRERATKSSPPFIVQVVANLQVSEALKYLADKDELMRDELLHIDLLYNEFVKIPL